MVEFTTDLLTDAQCRLVLRETEKRCRLKARMDKTDAERYEIQAATHPDELTRIRYAEEIVWTIVEAQSL